MLKALTCWKRNDGSQQIFVVAVIQMWASGMSSIGLFPNSPNVGCFIFMRLGRWVREWVGCRIWTFPIPSTISKTFGMFHDGKDVTSLDVSFQKIMRFFFVWKTVTSEVRWDGVLAEKFVVDAVVVQSNNIVVITLSYRVFPTQFRVGNDCPPQHTPSRFLHNWQTTVKARDTNVRDSAESRNHSNQRSSSPFCSFPPAVKELEQTFLS